MARAHRVLGRGPVGTAEGLVGAAAWGDNGRARGVAVAPREQERGRRDTGQLCCVMCSP